MKDDSGAQRVCPQCGNATTARLCPLDGWETIPSERVSATPHAPTDVLDRWQASALLTQDGALTWWGGRELGSGRAVRIAVVALPKTSDLADVARIQRAAKALEALAHPRIARTLATGIDTQGDLVVVCEQVPGPTLAEALHGGRFPPARTARLGVQLFEALEAAHVAGIMHHDLTPERIRITKDAGGAETIVLQDVGIADLARLPAGAREPDPTLLRPTTARYRAPEQSRDRAITRHADLYAAGAILYEMMCGRPVFDERTAADYLVAHLVKLPDRPRADGVPLEGPLVELILRCLEKKPWNRPESAANARDRLNAALSDPGGLATPQVRIMTSSLVTMTTEAPPALPPEARVQDARTLPSAPTPPPLPDLAPVAVTTRGTRRPTAPTVPAALPSLASAPGPRAVTAGARDAATSEPPVFRALVRRRRAVWPWVIAALVVLGAGLVVWRVTSADGTDAPELAGPVEPVPHERLAATRAPTPAPAPTPEPTPARPTTPEPGATPAPTPAPAPAPAPRPAEDAPLVLEALDETASEPPKKVEPTEPPKKVEPTDEPAERPDPPPAASLRRAMLTTDPPGAKVLLDGRAIGKTPMTVSWEEGAEPTLQVRLSGYDPAFVTLEAGSANRMLSLALVKNEREKPGPLAPTDKPAEKPAEAPPSETPSEDAGEPTTPKRSLLERDWRPR